MKSSMSQTLTQNSLRGQPTIPADLLHSCAKRAPRPRAVVYSSKVVPLCIIADKNMEAKSTRNSEKNRRGEGGQCFVGDAILLHFSDEPPTPHSKPFWFFFYLYPTEGVPCQCVFKTL